MSNSYAGWRWLSSTYELQTETYGYDLKGLRQAELDGDAGLLASYINWNQTAAVQELAELREEFSWKPWAVDEQFVNKQRIIEESVDVLHFIGNIMVGLGVTDDEFWAHYRSKQRKNIVRQASGTYSAKKGGLALGSEL